jgi:hypothetical protein
MIYPFKPRPIEVKLASLEFALLGAVIYWDAEGRRIEQQVESGEHFILRHNSIAFVTLEPYLQLPDYIALRFNLKIRNVYQGLLLGTGPLVDPGYQGRLSIPLHNLTTNDYTLIGGEPLITVEFTKLAPHPRWKTSPNSEPNPQRVCENLYIPYGEPKTVDPEDTDRNVHFQLLRADQHRAIRSSLSDALYRTRKAANRANVALGSGALLTGLGLILALGALLSAVWDTRTYSSEIQNDLRIQMQSQGEIQKQLNSRILLLEDSLLELRKRVLGQGSAPGTSNED